MSGTANQQKARQTIQRNKRTLYHH